MKRMRNLDIRCRLAIPFFLRTAVADRHWGAN